MTSSFSNLVGTERDRIPDLPVSNYASTEANMEEAVNKQIDANILDQERFFKELGDIEALKAQNFFDNLSSLNQLVGSVAQFQEARERNREARETLKFAKNADVEGVIQNVLGRNQAYTQQGIQRVYQLKQAQAREALGIRPEYGAPVMLPPTNRLGGALQIASEVVGIGTGLNTLFPNTFKFGNP